MMKPLDPDAEEFKAVRGELARLYIQHAAELGFGGWSDERIAGHVNAITTLLVTRSAQAAAEGDAEWLDRFQWFGEAIERLMQGRGTTLDG